MKYFDLHIHCSTKSSLCINKTAWDEVRINDHAKPLVQGFRNVIDSQANLTQVTAAGYELVVVPLVGLEKAFAKNKVIKNLLPKNCPLDQQMIKDIIRDRLSYHQSFQRDLTNLQNSIDQYPNRIKLLKTAQDYDPQKLNVLISIEGAHCFHEKNQEAVALFQALKSNYRVFYLTLTHLSRAWACNHAYGVKVTVGITGNNTDEEFDDTHLTVMGSGREFMPWSKGFFQLGVDLVKECYQQPTDKITLVDIKHMSFYARQYFYTLRITHGWRNIPIIASHMGVTGTSYQNNTYIKSKPHAEPTELKKLKFWRKKGLGNTLFNPWTINLYDEEIVTILESKGLIGISLDQRIVGTGKVYGEWFSSLELTNSDPLSLSYYVKPSLRNPDTGHYVPWNEVENGSDNEESVQDYLEDILAHEGDMPETSSISSFINNLLHIVKIGLQNGFNGTYGKVHVWDHVCIGSDLDGLVDSLDYAHDKFNFVTASNISLLYEKLKTDIKIMAAYDPTFDYQISDIDNKLEKLFYSNGKEFALKFLRGQLM